jgi:hypothetical protein
MESNEWDFRKTAFKNGRLTKIDIALLMLGWLAVESRGGQSFQAWRIIKSK